MSTTLATNYCYNSKGACFVEFADDGFSSICSAERGCELVLHCSPQDSLGNLCARVLLMSNAVFSHTA